MHSKCQEMTTDCMCSFILPSQPGLLYVPAAYGELLKADQRHILTQDRFDWNLYDNHFLFNLRETQSDGMRQRGKTGASISFFHHTVLVGRRFLSVSQLIHGLSGLPQTLPRLLSSLRSSSFHHLEPWLCLLLLASPCLNTRLPALLPLPSPPCHAPDPESFWPLAL